MTWIGRFSWGLLAVAGLWASGWAAAPAQQRSLEVTATAYNSVPDQTEGDPAVGAWGDELRPGVKAVAVSPDLLELGLTRGTRIRVEGLPGEYQVLDKMPARWQRKIDIYMGDDVDAAVEWGRREVTIFWSATGEAGEI